MEVIRNTDLGIYDADSYNCKLWGFRYSHSLMLIRAYRGDFMTGKSVYLMFGEVHYFEGPTNWKGVGFHFGDREEVLDLIRKMKESSGADFSEADLLNACRLYKFGSDPTGVKILAEVLYPSEDVPKEFT